MSDLDELCFQYECAISQREISKSETYEHNSTEGYKKMGCYDCNGLKQSCKAYYSISNIKNLNMIKD